MSCCLITMFYVFLVSNAHGDDIRNKLDDISSDLGMLKTMIFHADARMKSLEATIKDLKKGM